MTLPRATSCDPASVGIKHICSDNAQTWLIPCKIIARTLQDWPNMTPDMALLGSSDLVGSKKQTWVQTERLSHEAWAELIHANAKAAALLHLLVAHMDQQSAVVVSRATLAGLLRCSETTVKRATALLKAERWIEVIQVGGKGGVNAYVINSRVAWADSREKLPNAIFTATVIASGTEQEVIDDEPLRRIPMLYAGERQLPTGPGRSQGDTVDLPAVAGFRL